MCKLDRRTGRKMDPRTKLNDKKAYWSKPFWFQSCLEGAPKTSDPDGPYPDQIVAPTEGQSERQESLVEVMMVKSEIKSWEVFEIFCFEKIVFRQKGKGKYRIKLKNYDRENQLTKLNYVVRLLARLPKFNNWFASQKSPSPPLRNGGIDQFKSDFVFGRGNVTYEIHIKLIVLTNCLSPISHSPQSPISNLSIFQILISLLLHF